MDVIDARHYLNDKGDIAVERGPRARWPTS